MLATHILGYLEDVHLKNFILEEMLKDGLITIAILLLDCMS